MQKPLSIEVVNERLSTLLVESHFREIIAENKDNIARYGRDALNQYLIILSKKNNITALQFVV